MSILKTGTCVIAGTSLAIGLICLSDRMRITNKAASKLLDLVALVALAHSSICSETSVRQEECSPTSPTVSEGVVSNTADGVIGL